MNKCTMSIPSKVGHIHNNKPIRGIDDPAVLLHRGLCCHTQPPSPLRHSWWAQPHHQGGGGEDGGWETQTASTQREKERERETGWVLPPLTHTHTHHWVTAAGRREHPSLILFRKTRLPFLLSELLKLSPGSTLFNIIRARDTAEVRRNRAWKRCESRRILQHQGQRPWLQWWRRGLSSVSPGLLSIRSHVQP